MFIRGHVSQVMWSTKRVNAVKWGHKAQYFVKIEKVVAKVYNMKTNLGAVKKMDMYKLCGL